MAIYSTLDRAVDAGLQRLAAPAGAGDSPSPCGKLSKIGRESIVEEADFEVWRRHLRTLDTSGPQSQNLAHWRLLRGSGVAPPTAEAYIDSTGRKAALATIYAAQCGCFASTVGCDRDRLLAEFEVITEEDLAHPVGVEVKTLKNRDPNDLPRYKGSATLL